MPKRLARKRRKSTLARADGPTPIKILNAATAEFARWGYGGARIERISARAGTNDQSLYYYFSSKQKLFRAVLENAYLNLTKAEVALNIDALDPIDGIERLVEFTWKYYFENPELLSLINTENIYRGEHIRQSSWAAIISQTQMNIINNILERGKATGVFRSSIDPVSVFLTISALSYFYISNRYTLSTYLGFDLMEDSKVQHWLQHMKRTVVRMMLPDDRAS